MIKFAEVQNIVIQGTLESHNKSATGDVTTVTLTVDGFETQVMLLLSELRWSMTGWAVLVDIFYRKTQEMLIIPWTDMPNLNPAGYWDGFNATAGAKDIKGATPKGQEFLQCGGPNQTKPLSTSTVGTGKGSSTVVRYTPTMWDAGVAKAAGFGSGPGVKKDEILLHEMIHGLRQMSGTALCSATPDNKKLDTVEEFMAIVITNIYRSEKGRPDLRADHGGFLSLPKDQQDPKKFVTTGDANNAARLKQLALEHPRLVSNLKLVKAPFNPFLAI